MCLMMMNTKLKLNYVHGNSKRLSKDYYRISHTTIERLKELNKSDPPSIEVKGTISDFRNAAGHARNIKQIKNTKKTMVELLRDPLLELMNMLNKETDTEKTPSSVK